MWEVYNSVFSSAVKLTRLIPPAPIVAVLTPYYINEIKRIVCRGSLGSKMHALILQGKLGIKWEP